MEKKKNFWEMVRSAFVEEDAETAKVETKATESEPTPEPAKKVKEPAKVAKPEPKKSIDSTEKKKFTTNSDKLIESEKESEESLNQSIDRIKNQFDINMQKVVELLRETKELHVQLEKLEKEANAKATTDKTTIEQIAKWLKNM